MATPEVPLRHVGVDRRDGKKEKDWVKKSKGSKVFKMKNKQDTLADEKDEVKSASKTSHLTTIKRWLLRLLGHKADIRKERRGNLFKDILHRILKEFLKSS